MTTGIGPWPWVVIDFTAESLSREAAGSVVAACDENAEAVGRLGTVLKACVQGRRLGDMETMLERPPRTGLIDDEPGMFLAYHGEYASSGGRRRLYRLELAGEMTVFFSVARDLPARIERFCRPDAVSATAAAIRDG